jgi:hypothetical protein
MTCSRCNGYGCMSCAIDTGQVKLANSIKIKGYPVTAPYYKESHSEASNAEKRQYPEQYRDMKKIDAELPQGEYSGSHTPTGQVIISRKVPPKDRPTVELHERTEFKAEKRLEKEHRK